MLTNFNVTIVVSDTPRAPGNIAEFGSHRENR